MSLIDRLAKSWRRSREASRHYGCSMHAIVWRAIGLYVKRDLRPVEAFEAGLGNPAVAADIVNACFSKAELMALQDKLNPVRLTGLTEDKSVFYPFCQAVGLPIPTTCAVISRTGGWLPPGAPVTSREQWLKYASASLPSSCVVKPATGVYGEAIAVWSRSQDLIVDHRGRQSTLSGLFDELRNHPKYDCFVIQERLCNHAAIVALTACPALQTVRIATLLDESGEPHLLYAEWKLIVGNHVSDNFMRGQNGNLMANVALESGVIGPGRMPARNGVGFDAVVLHPVTQLPLSGFQLPCWPEVCELARRAARLFSPLRTIGWDVALTPSGPVLVEGNRWWDPPNDALIGPQAPGVDVHEMVEAARRLRSSQRVTAKQ